MRMFIILEFIGDVLWGGNDEMFWETINARDSDRRSIAAEST